MSKDELVPLKTVLLELGVSRATLWRALKSNIAGTPQPTRVRRRLHWMRREIAALDAALDAFPGRSAFEQRQTREKLSASARKAKLVQMQARKTQYQRVGARRTPARSLQTTISVRDRC